MVSRRNRTLASLSLFLAVWAWNASAAAVKGETAGVDVGDLTSPQIEEQLQVINFMSRAQLESATRLTDIRTALSSMLSMPIRWQRIRPHQV